MFFTTDSFWKGVQYFSLAVCLFLSAFTIAFAQDNIDPPGADIDGEPGFSLEEGLNKILPAGQENVRPHYLVGSSTINRRMKADIAEVTNQIQKLINGFTLGAATIAVIFIVYHGSQMAMFSAGNDSKAQEHLQSLMLSIAGLLLIIFSYVIVKTVVAVTYSGENLVGDIEEDYDGQ